MQILRFRPLAGFWFLNNKEKGVTQFKQNGFRPLAGFWFLNPYPYRACACCRGFPSPCGVLVLKYEHLDRLGAADESFRPLAGFWFLNRNYTKLERKKTGSFRPLAGFWFLNMNNNTTGKALTKEFPSPCGVLVLKSPPMTTYRQTPSVSVPLRGSGS